MIQEFNGMSFKKQQNLVFILAKILSVFNIIIILAASVILYLITVKYTPDKMKEAARYYLFDLDFAITYANVFFIPLVIAFHYMLIKKLIRFRDRRKIDKSIYCSCHVPDKPCGFSDSLGEKARYDAQQGIKSGPGIASYRKERFNALLFLEIRYGSIIIIIAGIIYLLEYYVLNYFSKTQFPGFNIFWVMMGLPVLFSLILFFSIVIADHFRSWNSLFRIFTEEMENTNAKCCGVFSGSEGFIDWLNTYWSDHWTKGFSHWGFGIAMQFKGYSCFLYANTRREDILYFFMAIPGWQNLVNKTKFIYLPDFLYEKDLPVKISKAGLVIRARSNIMCDLFGVFTDLAKFADRQTGLLVKGKKASIGSPHSKQSEKFEIGSDIPGNIKIEKRDNSLIIYRSWGTKKSPLILLFPLMIIAYCLHTIYPTLPKFSLSHTAIYVILGIRIYFFYFIVALIFNVTKISISPDWLSIKHGPIPWPGNQRLDSSRLGPVSHKEIMHLGRTGATYTYKLYIDTFDDRNIVILKLSNEDETHFLEKVIEDYLDFIHT